MSENQLAIIAGGGSLSDIIIETAEKKGWNLTVFAIGDLNITKNQDIRLIEMNRLDIGRIFQILKSQNIKNICMVGYIPRPNSPKDYLNFRYLNVQTLSILFQSIGILRGGDASLFKKINSLLEKRGYKIIGASEIAPNLTLKGGLYSSKSVSKVEFENIKKAKQCAEMTGYLDIGQAVVVKNGRVLAIEAAEGTDVMLERVACLGGISIKRGGVILKSAQINQDERVDMPTIGPNTIKNVVKANLSGIAITADNVIVLDFQKVIEMIEDNNLYFIVI
ncbi:MAG: UDP-2,3-diacylglucosamine diphosphatase LpxI [Pseudomonadota bacterium]|nr:UDP-2,3-diacylglucosamine diphosphatase LpxI [Pseudomonadota bacterium]